VVCVSRLLTQGEIEANIADLSSLLEEQTYLYASQSEVAATTEADYKIRLAKAIVAFASDPTIKMTQHERQARCDLHCAAEFRDWKLAEAQRQSTKEALLSLRSRLDAMRTLSANVRHAT
jgi:hypothetical protein